MILNAVLLFLGMGLLYYGSEWMVKGSASLALSFNVRPAVVGLTIVAFATSSPELLVSLIAAFKGSSGISLGNVLGSNVANIGLVLGASAFFSRLKIDQNLVRREIPFMIAVAGLFWVLCLDGYLGRIDGAILLTILMVFLIMGIMTARDNHGNNSRSEIDGSKRLWFTFLILAGMGGLILGADLMVKSAIFFARKLGLSEAFIGLSIVAVGTSLPELATSVVAGAKDEHDISVGNVVGSNILNICLVVGCVGLLNPISIDPELLRFEFPAMFILSVLVYILCKTRFTVSRAEGLFYLFCYGMFVMVSYWMGKGN